MLCDISYFSVSLKSNIFLEPYTFHLQTFYNLIWPRLGLLYRNSLSALNFCKKRLIPLWNGPLLSNFCHLKVITTQHATTTFINFVLFFDFLKEHPFWSHDSIGSYKKTKANIVGSDFFKVIFLPLTCKWIHNKTNIYSATPTVIEQSLKMSYE